MYGVHVYLRDIRRPLHWPVSDCSLQKKKNERKKEEEEEDDEDEE
jgi:hypothetical protein